MGNLGKEDKSKFGFEAILKIIVMLRYGEITIHRLLALQLQEPARDADLISHIAKQSQRIGRGP